MGEAGAGSSVGAGISVGDDTSGCNACGGGGDNVAMLRGRSAEIGGGVHLRALARSYGALEADFEVATSSTRKDARAEHRLALVS